MLSDAKLVGFLGTTKPEACRQFYEEDLGLAFVVDEPFTLVFDSNGTMLRIGKMDELDPLPFTVLGWELEDLEAEVQRLKERGIDTEFFEGVDQDEFGIAEFGDTRVAWLKDPDGNILSLAQTGFS
jgi:catechol 2,3-dioxygenase-like lactoylglutathione lyase family enzyme